MDNVLHVLVSKSEFLKDQTFGPLLFLIYINNLSNDLKTTMKPFFTDGTFFCSS